MALWKVAAVQMDCRLGEKAVNQTAIRKRLLEAAQNGAQVVAFPECALTGYCFDSKAEALALAETVPGEATKILAEDCRRLGVWAVCGMLESSGDNLFNAAVLIGPKGQTISYRKIHLPVLGVDRFATPGDLPFAVHELGGLRIGINICYDGSFPESTRILTLLGADLVVLPTNWPTGANSTCNYLVQARALENHIYYAAVNRVGEERGFRFIGRSRFVDYYGELMASTESAEEMILYSVIDPEKARQKRVAKIPGIYEIDRVGHRRPEMYGPLAAVDLRVGLR
jgi:predicted amidohydrolase